MANLIADAEWTFSGASPAYGDVKQTPDGGFITTNDSSRLTKFTPTDNGEVKTDWIYANGEEATLGNIPLPTKGPYEPTSEGGFVYSSFVSNNSHPFSDIFHLTSTGNGGVTNDWVFTGHDEPVNDIESTANGGLVSGSDAQKVRHFSPTENGGVTADWTFAALRGEVNDVEPTSGGSILAATDFNDGTVRKLTPTDNGEVTTEWSFNTETGYEVEPTAANGFVGQDGSYVRHFTPTDEGGFTTDWVFSQDEYSFVEDVESTGAGSFVIADGGDTVRQFTPTSDGGTTTDWTFVGHGDSVRDVTVTADGGIVSASNDGTVKKIATPGGGGNEAPTPSDDSATVTPGESTTIDVLANDSDPDGDQLSITAINGGGGLENADLSSTPEGEIVFTAHNDFSGEVSFTYTVKDAEGATDTAEVTVTEEGSGGGGLQVGSGFYDAGSTFGEAIAGPSDTRYFKIFDADSGGFLTGPEGTDTQGNWLKPSSLESMDLESGDYFVQAWGDSGLSDWTRFSAKVGGQDSQLGHGPQTLPASQAVGLDELVDTENLAADAQVKVYTAQQTYGFMPADELANHTWNTPEAGQTRPVWVDTWLSGEGRSGWSSLDVTGDGAATLVGTTDAGSGGIEDGA